MLIKAQVLTFTLDTESIASAPGSATTPEPEREAWTFEGSQVWSAVGQFAAMVGSLAARMSAEASAEEAAARDATRATDDTVGEGSEPPAP